jgi:hypothetical protein
MFLEQRPILDFPKPDFFDVGSQNPRGGVGGGRGAQRGVSNLPPGHRVTDGFRWADRAESA